MKKICLLGCSGSIGKQTIDVIRTLDNIKIVSISFNNNIEYAKSVIEEFDVQYISCGSELQVNELKEIYPNKTFGFGESSLVDACLFDKDAVVINAVVGMVGLSATIKAIENDHDILIANKETLVTGGEIISELLKTHKVKLIPIDSEHSAILQCLDGKKEEINRIVITASGGAFREKERSELANVTIEDALKHPNWSMGKKITVDCATMVNKGLEVIEAHYLFGIGYDNIDTILHKESIVHSYVEFKDGSVIAELAKPDMRIPIQYALTYPKKHEFKLDSPIDLIGKNLSFKELDYKRYPMLKLAYEVGRLGGIMPTVYNSSNEAANKLFCNGKIKFLEIENIILESVNKYKNKFVEKVTLEEILKIDKEIKEDIFNRYK